MVPDIAKKGRSFKGAFAYYLHDKEATTAERIAWTETRNLATDDPHLASRIMIATACQADDLKRAAGIKATGRKSTQHVYAYSLAWHPSEAEGLSKAEMLKAADATLKELKADHLQSVIVCHQDQKHPHVHVIVNRVDPETGKMHGFSNDRLKLSDWANRYERERGEILTPKREERREKREQEPDRAKRQDYAADQKAEAAAKPPSPFAMLKELGEAQKERHRQEWRTLSAQNRQRREAIYDHYRGAIRQAAGKAKIDNKPKWRAYFEQERARVQAFEERERKLFGRIANAVEAAAFQHVAGELDGRGQLAATFRNVLSSQTRQRAMSAALDRDRQAFSATLRTPLDATVEHLKTARTQALEANRERFDTERNALIETHGQEWKKMDEAWTQLRARYGIPQNRRSKPVKREWDKRHRPQPETAKAGPTVNRAVSTPSPAPSPTGDVPRPQAKRTTVPKKDWTKDVPTEKRGLDAAKGRPKKDWGKTGSAAKTAQPVKDWGKKVERQTDRPKPTRPHRSFDRSR